MSVASNTFASETFGSKSAAPKIVLPYEPQYVGHRDAEERRRAVSEWLQQRERELDEHPSPSVVPSPAAPGPKN